MLTFENFSFRYAGSNIFALKKINLDIFEGEFVLVVGNSGSGKTTLLRSINGLIPHFYGGEYRGSVHICNMTPFKNPPREVSKCVGTVFQDPENQILMSTVEREIAFPLENMGFERMEIWKRVEEILEILGLQEIREKKISTLSGGEKQKVAIGAALAPYPRYLLLDEPTSQLDPNSAEELLSLLERLNDDLGLGIILVEHRMERTVHRADRLIVMDKGEIVGDGEPRLILSEIDMDSLSVGYPQITRIAKKFQIQYLPLTVKEGRKMLSQLLPKFVPKRVIAPKTEETLCQVSNVTFRYNSRRILRGVNLEIQKGEILGLMGRNGAGKTTLAKIIAGVLKPRKGEVKIGNAEVHALTERDRSNLVGLVFQNPNVHFFQDTIYQDILFNLSEKRRGNVDKIMKQLGIYHLRNRNYQDLSGGERMLSAVALMAAREPKLLILDEPTRGLSYGFKRRLISFLKDYASHNAVLLITHDMETMARACHRVALLTKGRIEVTGDKRKIMTSSLIFSTQLNKVLYGNSSNILVEEDIEGFQ